LYLKPDLLLSVFWVYLITDIVVAVAETVFFFAICSHQ